MCLCMCVCVCLDDDVSGSVDSLDAYMSSIGDHLDKTKRSEIKHQLHELRKVSLYDRHAQLISAPTVNHYKWFL